MKRICYATGCIAVLVASLAIVTAAQASPAPTFAVIKTRIFNDCPGSTLNTTDLDLTAIRIDDDAEPGCGGFANLHNWRLSEDDVNPVTFMNGDIFMISCKLVISGPGQGEAGLQIAPWFAPDTDGRFNIRTTDGEIAVFGGVLPFYSFTASQGVTYTKGQEIDLQINYVPWGNSAANPATIEYKFTYQGTFYTSGQLPMTGCNVAEQPIYGCYGILNFAQVGGHFQPLWQAGLGQQIVATWSKIEYAPEGKPTSVTQSSWGRMKTIYR
jgi:hypothetical protein